MDVWGINDEITLPGGESVAWVQPAEHTDQGLEEPLAYALLLKEQTLTPILRGIARVCVSDLQINSNHI